MSWKRFVLPTLNIAPQREKLAPEARAEGISRIIFQTYHSKDTPQEFRDNAAKMKAMNPGWEYRLYDDADIEAYIARHYPPFIMDYYKKINPRYGAARADLFRYLALYKEGGVYLDIKSSLSRPLDEVLRPDDCFVLSVWPKEELEVDPGWGAHWDLPSGEYQQWFVISAKGHPFLKAVIEYVLRNLDVYTPDLHLTGHFGTIRVTGPIAYTLAIEPLLSRYPHRFADSRSELGLIYSIYGNKTHHRKIYKHYTEIDEPLVQVAGLRRWRGKALSALRSIWARVKVVGRAPA